MPASLLTDMNSNSGGLEDQRALQIALELSMLGLNPEEQHDHGHGNTAPAINPTLEEIQRKKSQNMTECVPVPSSEHVAEIVGRQGKWSLQLFHWDPIRSFHARSHCGVVPNPFQNGGRQSVWVIEWQLRFARELIHVVVSFSFSRLQNQSTESQNQYLHQDTSARGRTGVRRNGTEGGCGFC